MLTIKLVANCLATLDFAAFLSPRCAEDGSGSGEDVADDAARPEEDEEGPGPARKRGIGEGAFAVVEVPGGRVKVYRDEQAQAFKATACCEAHGEDCQKSRTFKKSERGRLAQGRPMGFLVAWLKRGLEAGVLDADQHKWHTSVTRADRKAGRVVCHACECGEDVLAYERSPRSSESSEPAGQP